VKAAAVIVNWNSGAWLRQCIESLFPTGIDIVVVDNASSDDSLAQAGIIAPSLNVIRNNDNRGFAAGVNQGFKETSSPYVLVLNPDVQATGYSVQLLEEVLDRRPRVAAVGGYINDKYLPRPLATPWTLMRENLGFPKRASLNSQSPVEQPAAGALMIRREAFSAVGGFDERFVPAWYEDVDFCRRLKSAGWDLAFAAQARFAHKGGYSAEALGPSAFAAAYYRNQLRYVKKHFGRAGELLVRGSLVAGMAGRMVVGPHAAAVYSKVIAGALGGW
jgi:GT2 family glycosyltransferase